MYVLNASGQHISINASGSAATSPALFTFSNSQGLLSAGGNLFTSSTTSGTPVNSDEGFKQGFVEGSNVDLAQEMANLIVTQRGFQMSSSVVQTANQIETMTNDLKS
jgi:flagellar hook protein FlgE